MPDSMEQRIRSLEQYLASQPRSPLFAQLAGYYLQQGKANDALRVCDQGLAHYPLYSTAHLVKGKALLELKMIAEARREFELVHELLPTNETVTRLLAETNAGTEIALTATPPPASESAPPTAGTEVRVVGFKRPSPPETVAPPEPSPTPVVEQLAPSFEAAPSATVEELPPTPAIEEKTVEQQPAADAFAGTAEVTQPPSEIVPSEEAVSSPILEEPVSQEPVLASTTEDPFGLAGTSIVEQPTTVEPSTSEVVAPPSSDQAFAEVPPAPAEVPAASGEGSFEQYAARKRAEWAGTENTMKLDAYVSAPLAEASPTSEIEDLAQKLQTAKKITPVINLTEKAASPTHEQGTAAGSGFVTPTLAEIYAKQGWYDDAIRAFKTLAGTRPTEREKYEKRIQELEELKKQQGA